MDEQNKIKVLIIPADSISKGISRSYYLTKGLAQLYDVYKLIWNDPQENDFNSSKMSKFYTLKCFLKSFLTFTKISFPINKKYRLIRLPRLSFIVIYKILGINISLKLARFFNKIMLERITKKIKPDVIFYADGFDLYPFINGSHLTISDVQDDFGPQNFRNSEYQRNYGKINFNKSSKNFVVSQSARKKLEKYYSAKFEYLPNGVDVDGMFNIDQNLLEKYKVKYCHKDKLYVSYIGGRVWVDNGFAKELFSIAQEKYPFIQFILIGNHTNFNMNNVTELGSLSNNETYYFYHLSDVGIMLKDSKNDQFLLNSQPLKIAQYSILDKYFVSPKINWLEEEFFSNIKIINTYRPEELLFELKKYWNSSKNKITDNKWLEYDWDNISSIVANYIKEEIL